MNDKHRAAAELLSRQMADQGLLIEAGWICLRAMAIPQHAPTAQVNEMRMAFMAGAQHLFASIMAILDPGEDPTEGDMRRLDLIERELRSWAATCVFRTMPPEGRA